jgi:hypothetical protein
MMPRCADSLEEVGCEGLEKVTVFALASKNDLKNQQRERESTRSCLWAAKTARELTVPCGCLGLAGTAS